MAKTGRNDPCPCGSGKKHKKCCGLERDASGPALPTRVVPAEPQGLAGKPDRRAEPIEAARSPSPTATNADRRKLVLIHPLYATATAPPLGVCVLKGFVERTLPHWSVRVMDLNLEGHQEFLQRLGDRSLLSGPKFPEGALGEIALSRAAETFRGEHPEEFYRRPDRMVLGWQLWQRVMPAAISSPAALRAALQEDGPVPPWVERHADLVLQEQPTMVGMSICYSQQITPGLCLARALKRRARVPIILGGSFFNCGLDPSWKAHQWPVDAIVAGAGERALARILSGEADSQPVPGVSRIAHGRLVTTPPSFDADLDATGEPDFSDVSLRDYYSPEPVLPVMTSRGCYWRRCSFCAHYKSAGDTYQQRSIPAVIAELERHVARGVRHFAFVDDIIAPARFSHLADGILEAGLAIHYYAMAKPVKQFDAEVLQRMCRSGCRFVIWGLESGCQRVLDLMDKGTKVAEIEAVLSTAAEAGLKNHVFVICGFPTETRDEFQATVDLLTRHKAHIARVHKTVFVMDRDTPVFDHPERFSITRLGPSKNPTLYDFECASGMTRAEARQVLEEVKPLLRSFDSPVPQLADFRARDHLLLLYSHALGHEPRAS